MTKPSIVFFGTHTFAATILKALLNDPSIKIELVITQPDRPVGREQVIKPGPVKELAIAKRIPVDQPDSLKNYTLSAKRYTLGITAQYGGLIPKHVLETPEHGILNVHTSLLPKYRGASPIQSAIMNGETETGVTIMKMDEGLDTGPILLQKKVVIGPYEMYLELDSRLATLGATTLLETIPRYLYGDIVPQPQDESQATFCKQLTREDGKIDWSCSEQEIYNQCRALTPWPGIWTTWEGKRLKLLKTIFTDEIGVANVSSPGQVAVAGDKIFVQTGSGYIEILELQLEGKKAMDAKMFLTGHAEIDCIHLASS